MMMKLALVVGFGLGLWLFWFARGVWRDLDEYGNDPQVYNFTGYGGRLREQERTVVGAVDETGRVPPVGTFRLVPGGFEVPITRRRP